MIDGSAAALRQAIRVAMHERLLNHGPEMIHVPFVASLVVGLVYWLQIVFR